jgi:diaminohydroxyphosphoribosylaminopyrimidine deaminase/5-amino-6-(5-phosphoribosylamino)uracil reductase
MEAKIGSVFSDDEAMAIAISEAYKGAGRVSPNPLVGCVILDSKGVLLSKGYHEFYGGPHAEVNALKNLTEKNLKGAHVFVTLEPCAHEGKTPSCAKALAKLPIEKLTYGLIDPNPLVAGKGVAILEAAGIKTQLFNSSVAALNEELELVCEAFLWNFKMKKPFVTLKVATSLDGQIGLKNGESQWITGAESREYVHLLRSTHDAVLVGAGTVKIDNPSLNVRHPLIQKENKVIILDTNAEVISDFENLNLSKVHKSENIFWCVSGGSFKKAKEYCSKMTKYPQLISVDLKSEDEMNLDDLLEKLFEKEVRSILVEGGALTASSFLRDSKVNRICVFQAPIIIGSGGGKSWTENLKISSMKSRVHVRNVRTSTFGQDIMWSGRLI